MAENEPNPINWESAEVKAARIEALESLEKALASVEIDEMRRKLFEDLNSLIERDSALHVMVVLDEMEKLNDKIETLKKEQKDLETQRDALQKETESDEEKGEIVHDLNSLITDKVRKLREVEESLIGRIKVIEAIFLSKEKSSSDIFPPQSPYNLLKKSYGIE